MGGQDTLPPAPPPPSPPPPSASPSFSASTVTDEPVVDNKEAEKQAKIRMILADRTKSPQERQAEISCIMRGGAAAGSRSPLDTTTTFTLTGRSPTVPSAIPCAHYPDKKCGNMHFSCCGVNDHCHRCHRENYPNCKIFPAEVSTVQCMDCNTIQSPSKTCCNPDCMIEFCKSYCDKCKIWSSKDMVHCEKCGICRVGTANEIFHCDPCGACFMACARETHVCSGRSSKDVQCHFCLDYVHHSQTPVITLPCNHMVHENCANSALRQNCYRCPVCRSSMVDMSDHWEHVSIQIEVQPMPKQYCRECEVDCFDCHKRSTASFHFLGIQCPLCLGYNTSEK